ncbi:MAG: Single-stranded nucleic acid binding R3H domain protein [Candidatus Woesebacteria bacterium GW2011_GWB1_44_11]|uniref:Single-stranded nucleic acid binding R3H domain protein n=1 Tax=Candidatus Woesebacteria bacterium GW2011_GWB1_44_11 TaxID=1618579 RepID=A0A837I9N8_9BACT|nr:MAG: Single-stranded nucleic acid binding R3H domain protein [Candidatus Woesebacteria bacterium GW2011_GWB1_44_11]
MQNKVKILQELVDELLSLMATKAKAEASYDKDNEAFVVNIDAGDETGLLIGKKGETLLGIQTILGFLLKQKTGEWNRLLVNVGDYREKEEGYLKDLAASTAQRAKETGEPQNLYNLKAWQRRVIHLALSEDKSVTTESEGEGEERHLVIKSKK